jgi:hypothetical protein
VGSSVEESGRIAGALVMRIVEKNVNPLFASERHGIAKPPDATESQERSDNGKSCIRLISFVLMSLDSHSKALIETQNAL